MSSGPWSYDLDEQRIYCRDTPILEVCAEVRDSEHSRQIDALMATLVDTINTWLRLAPQDAGGGDGNA